MKKIIILSLAIIYLSSCSQNEYEYDTYKKLFDSAGYAGCFVLYDVDEDIRYYVNKKRAQKRYSPASTFKIVNSLIALETKAVDSEHDTIKYNGIEKPIESWNRDHDLASAFRYSVVWYYQDIARRIGERQMEIYLDSLKDYGDMERAGGIDTFWLDGSLKISADEQVDFLTKLKQNKFAFFSETTVEIVKDIMIAEQSNDYTLRAKTGASLADSVGWYVGWVEKADKPYIFALNISPKDSIDNEFLKQRISLTKKLLGKFEVIEN